MRRVRNFKEYRVLLESFSSYGMTQEEYEKSVMRVKRCVSKILMKGGFFGNVLAEIPVAVSEDCEYFSTDGTVFIFNPKNVLNMSDDEVIWAISQGVIHLALQHFDRKSGHDTGVWNQACDIAAEPFLEGSGKSNLPNSYRNPIFFDKSAEEIYKDLKSGRTIISPDSSYVSACEVLEPGEINQGNITETVMGSLDQDEPQQNIQQKPEDNKEPKEPKEPKDKGEPGDDEQEGEPGDEQEGEPGDEQEGEPGEDGQEGEPGDDGQEGEPGQEGEGKGKGKGKGEGQPGEEDGEPGEEGEGWDDGKEEDKSNWKPDIKKSPKPPVSKADVAKKVEEITQRAANKGTGGGGTSPALRKFLEDMVNPQVDWKKILQKYVSEANEEATLYKIPNRRFVSSDLYLPGLIGKEEGFGTVVIAVDTSGSIGSDEYNTFLAETRKILKMFGPKEVYIIYCSDGMKPPSGDIDHLLSASQPLDPSKQKSTGGNGGGFDPPFKWTDENIVRKGKDLACFIYFTDGGAENPERPKWHKKVIWAMTTSHKMPFGKHVNVPVKKLRNY